MIVDMFLLREEESRCSRGLLLRVGMDDRQVDVEVERVGEVNKSFVCRLLCGREVPHLLFFLPAAAEWPDFSYGHPHNTIFTSSHTTALAASLLRQKSHRS